MIFRYISRADQLSKCQNSPSSNRISIQSPISSRKYPKQENAKKSTSDLASKDRALEVNGQQGTKAFSTSSKNESLDIQKHEATNMEKVNQPYKPSIDGFPSRITSNMSKNTEKRVQVVPPTDHSVTSDQDEDPSSRKTSSSSNGSNSTTDSSSSFSCHPLKTLPENPGLQNNNKNRKESATLDPGQLLNAWLGELDNLQKVFTRALVHLHLDGHPINPSFFAFSSEH